MQRLQWSLGTLCVGTAIGQSAIIAHYLPKLESDSQRQIKLRQSLENARLVTMLNGLGLALISLRQSRSAVSVLPTTMLIAGTGLFSGLIFYEAVTKDARAHGLIKFGGTASILGWVFMGLL